MNFPGGTAQLPDAPTCSGLSGSQQVWPTEPPHSFDKLSDAALARLAVDLCTLMEVEDPAELAPSLVDYITLLTGQVQAEVVRRSHVPR